jgi:hypothetical protein
MTEAGVNEITEGQYNTYNACIPYDKANAFAVPAGAPESLIWQFRNADGTPVDLSKWFDLDDPNNGTNRIYGNFAFADYAMVLKKPVRCTVLDPAAGKIQITLPPAVYNNPCIYVFQAKITPKGLNKDPLYISHNRGILLVEWSPFLHDRTQKIVPTLEDIRRKLDDFVGKNDLTNEVEYSADDIMYAMVSPVRWFNEEGVHLRRFTFNVSNFPFYENWVTGTAAELLQRAISHLIRNKLQVTHGNITGDEKNRDREYTQMAAAYIDEYKQWARAKKNNLNYSMGQGWGTAYSDYAFI